MVPPQKPIPSVAVSARRSQAAGICLALACLAAALAFPRRPAAAEPVPVVASFSILGDITRQIAGSAAQVKTLVGPDADAHVFQPTPADARAVGEAKLLVSNGLGFDRWIDRLAKSSKTKAVQVVATKGLTPLKAKETHTHGHDHGSVDPHAWHDLRLIETYAANIAQGLIQVAPGSRAGIEARAADYTRQALALDADIRSRLQAIPADKRRVITSHDAFAYFGAAYGVTFRSAQGLSTDGEPSARQVAGLIRQIRTERTKAIFVENMNDPRLVEQVAKEAGATVGGKLYSDALSAPGGEAATYLDLMRRNADRLIAAMQAN